MSRELGRARRVAVTCLGVILVALTAGAPQRAQRPANPGSRFAADFASHARVVLTPDSVRRFLHAPSPSTWQPAVNAETFRGGVELYERVAPAVVVVRSEIGHGTGFLISPDGLLLTNHHVIDGGLRHDGPGPSSRASVHLGRMSGDGIVTLREEPVRALVHKLDPIRDLALLKLEEVPEDSEPLPYLRLADEPPRPGQPAAIIGHPSSGMLWTYRSGEVASVGWAPADLVNVLMPRLAASGVSQVKVNEVIDSAPSRRIILSSCEANPGDSGGPVVDEEGRLIAVTFAIPIDPSEAKFSYHVHLDEVRAFLEDVPGAPMLVVPNTWDIGLRTLLDDLDSDGRPDLLVSGDEQARTFLLDLDNDTPPSYLREENLEGLLSEEKWDFEVGWYLRPGGAALAAYDRDNRGGIDLILEGDPITNVATESFRIDDEGHWAHQGDLEVELWSVEHLVDPASKDRFVKLDALMR